MISNECLYAKGRICISYAECLSSSSLHLCIFSKISYLFYLGSKTISEKNYHFLDLHTLTLSLSLSSNLTLFPISLSVFAISLSLSLRPDFFLSHSKLHLFCPFLAMKKLSLSRLKEKKISSILTLQKNKLECLPLTLLAPHLNQPQLID